MNKLLATQGQGYFYETNYPLTQPTDNEIQVKNIMTGVCRSDIDMMQGTFSTLPLSMQGHEGLAEVIQIGSKINDVQIGDIVATRGEPAYADWYNVRYKEYVKVPDSDPKYILEPVACGINVLDQAIEALEKCQGPNSKLLLLGSGFLAWIVYQSISLYNLDYNITVVGNSNKHLWKDRMVNEYDGQFDVVIDLSGRLDVFEKDILKSETLVVLGNQKTVTTDFGNLLWKACTIVFPSPRTENFYRCMQLAAEWIQEGQLSVEGLWTRGYSRKNEWQDAFSDSLNRQPGFSRAYIDWRN